MVSMETNTKLIQNLGGQTKSIMVFSSSGNSSVKRSQLNSVSTINENLSIPQNIRTIFLKKLIFHKYLEGSLALTPGNNILIFNGLG